MAQIEIYTTPFCPFCHRAKALLGKKGVAFQEFDVMMDAQRRKEMESRSGGRGSVPQVFVDGVHLGDCNKLYDMEFDGTLDDALKIDSKS